MKRFGPIFSPRFIGICSEPIHACCTRLADRLRIVLLGGIGMTSPVRWNRTI
jgi:hypothetical protein